MPTQASFQVKVIPDLVWIQQGRNLQRLNHDFWIQSFNESTTNNKTGRTPHTASLEDTVAIGNRAA
jgi:hypothetical protein